MKNRLLEIIAGSNLIAKQRAKRALRIRYGIVIPSQKTNNDPAWLSAHN